MFEHAAAPELLQLMAELGACPDIAQKFYLARGTALALHLGHRQSDDLDFFTSEP